MNDPFEELEEAMKRSAELFARHQAFMHSVAKRYQEFDRSILSQEEFDSLTQADVKSYLRDRLRCLENATLSLEEIIHAIREVDVKTQLLLQSQSGRG